MYTRGRRKTLLGNCEFLYVTRGVYQHWRHISVTAITLAESAYPLRALFRAQSRSDRDHQIVGPNSWARCSGGSWGQSERSARRGEAFDGPSSKVVRVCNLAWMLVLDDAKLATYHELAKRAPHATPFLSRPKAPPQPLGQAVVRRPS